LKFLKTNLYVSDRKRPVLGVVVGLNFIDERELFDKKHLLHAIQTYIPKAQAVEHSFIVDRVSKKNIQLIYLEIEKEQQEFSLEDIQLLRLSLPEQLQGHIEYLMHPIFMPRNEEEVLRNIMVLSRQLKYVDDIPQVIITFDEQQGLALTFTVILLRILKKETPDIAVLLHQLQENSDITVDKVKNTGTVRKKYVKEACVFRVFVGVKNYLRMNHSVDLYKARDSILSNLMQVFGEIRDYNGGMLDKQNELFNALKKRLQKVAIKHAFLLEKFFFSLTPIEMRSIAPVKFLKNLFLLLLQMTKKTQAYRNCSWCYKIDDQKVMIILHKPQPAIYKKIQKELSYLPLTSHQFLSFSLEHKKPYLGYLLISDSTQLKHQLLHIVEHYTQPHSTITTAF
jgi:hypothetical protein